MNHTQSFPRIAGSVAAGVLISQIALTEEPPTAKAVDPQDVHRKADVVREASSNYGLSSPFIVEGTRGFGGRVLIAQELVLHPGSRLVLEGARSFGEEQDELHIAARTVRVVAGTPPPTITWLRPEGSQSKPIPVGKAAPGGIGATEGSDGGLGEPGQLGNPGYPGRSAPNVFLFVGRLIGGPINVDLAGQDGGEGGIGQEGGDGGFGRQGRGGISSVFDCRSGGGDGGRGGQGGKGGKGGTGGRGGYGGSFVIVSTEPVVKAALQQFTVESAGGKGGLAGPGGPGGKGGTGGGGGSGSTYCKGGSPGPAGELGQVGPGGEKGPDGVPGVFTYSYFTAANMNYVFGARQAK